METKDEQAIRYHIEKIVTKVFERTANSPAVLNAENDWYPKTKYDVDKYIEPDIRSMVKDFKRK